MLKRELNTHRSLDILWKDRATPRMVQINADSTTHSVFVHSTPTYRNPGSLDFCDLSFERVNLKYDDLSWVKFSNIDTSNISIEKLA